MDSIGRGAAALIRATYILMQVTPVIEMIQGTPGNRVKLERNHDRVSIANEVTVKKKNDEQTGHKCRINNGQLNRVNRSIAITVMPCAIRRLRLTTL
jgi:hypothetical protein